MFYHNVFIVVINSIKLKLKQINLINGGYSMCLELKNAALNNRFAFILALMIASTGCVHGFAVPGDLDCNMIISEEELNAAWNDFNNSDINSSTLDTIIHIHRNYPRNITDSSGRHIEIYMPMNRIVPIGYSITEILKSMGSENKVVAVDEYAKKRTGLFPELSKLPSIGNTMSPDIETILELDPDLVVMWKGDAFGTKYDEIQKTLEKANPNLTIVRFDFLYVFSSSKSISMSPFMISVIWQFTKASLGDFVY